MAEFVSSENTQGRINNSDLELATLVIQEVTFLFFITNPDWRAPFTSRENTPTVA